MKKIGVLLIQLGTPDSPKKSDVRKYLREFLNDPRVIDIPAVKRSLLVNGIIIPFRTPKSAKIYEELWAVGNGKSPLLTYTESLLELVKERFKDDDVTIEMAMRYQSPSMDSVLARMEKAHYDKIIVLPLYPQYASASTGSSVDKAMKIMKKWWSIPEISVIRDFWDHKDYIGTMVERAKAFEIDSYDHVIFSYHGLPTRQVTKTHPDYKCNLKECKINDKNRFCYRAQSFATTELIAKELNLPKDKYTVSFQSRLDNEWLEPFSDKVVEELAKKGAKRLLVFSPAFVADCLETIIEIGSEYQEIFEEHGGKEVQLVPSCNDHPMFVDCVEDLIRKRI